MNLLKREKQERAIAALVEGSSIRSVERMTGVHRDTVMRLGKRIGDGCARLLDATMRGLKCQRVQVDEAWTFVGKKQRHLTVHDDFREMGDFWAWVAIDADTKLVPAHRIGKRDQREATGFIRDLARRVSCRIQLSSDGLAAYVDAVEQGFGGCVDYGQIVKSYETTHVGYGRYSPPEVVSVSVKSVQGDPDSDHISTSYVEKQNHTMRMHIRRMTRLTNAFSKRVDNLKAAVAMHFAYYNFVKIHKSLRMTPAMAAGVTPKLWTLSDLITEAEAHC